MPEIKAHVATALRDLSHFLSLGRLKGAKIAGAARDLSGLRPCSTKAASNQVMNPAEAGSCDSASQTGRTVFASSRSQRGAHRPSRYQPLRLPFRTSLWILPGPRPSVSSSPPAWPNGSRQPQSMRFGALDRGRLHPPPHGRTAPAYIPGPAHRGLTAWILAFRALAGLRPACTIQGSAHVQITHATLPHRLFQVFHATFEVSASSNQLGAK